MLASEPLLVLHPIPSPLGYSQLYDCTKRKPKKERRARGNGQLASEDDLICEGGEEAYSKSRPSRPYVDTMLKSELTKAVRFVSSPTAVEKNREPPQPPTERIALTFCTGKEQCFSIETLRRRFSLSSYVLVCERNEGRQVLRIAVFKRHHIRISCRYSIFYIRKSNQLHRSPGSERNSRKRINNMRILIPTDVRQRELGAVPASIPSSSD